jgi:hypothetical protein
MHFIVLLAELYCLLKKNQKRLKCHSKRIATFGGVYHYGRAYRLVFQFRKLQDTVFVKSFDDDSWCCTHFTKHSSKSLLAVN